MNRLLRRITSVRGRLTLWNTTTFALLLICLGVVFRFLASSYLLSALDREMNAQAKRMQAMRTVRQLTVSDAGKERHVSMSVIETDATVSTQIAAPQDRQPVHVEVRRDFGALLGDKSGQFQYRSFGINGKQLTPHVSIPPSFNMLTNGGVIAIAARPEQYKPWDSAALSQSAAGKELFSNVEQDGVPLRVLSIPLRDEFQIIGTAQISVSLAPVYRDIAGLTRTLFLILPPALLIAGLAGVFLTDRALRPVKNLTEAATQIQPNQLQQRLPVSGADEFDELAATFNRALGRVEVAFLERERMMSQLRQFTGDASHELRTPLTTIKANTGVALTEETPSQEHLHALRQIDRAADRMTALVEDLLLLARSDAGELAQSKSIVSLGGAIREAVDLLPKPVSPVVEAHCDEAHQIVGNPDAIIRLFRNLLENALRYTPPDGCITVTTSADERTVQVKISDTGAGIAAEHLPHLGERFYRADAGRNRRHGGAGLGLSICRSIAADHGGEISFESMIGSGTTITIVFPRPA